MEFKPAKLDPIALLTSIITGTVLIFFSLFFLVKQIPFGWLFSLLMVAIIIISYLLSPKTYYIQGGSFVIEKVIGRKITIPLNVIEGIVQIENFNKLKPVRSMGNGGLFGYYGIYTTKDFGNVNCQLTRLKNILIIKSKKGCFAISPDKPERLIDYLKAINTDITINEPVKLERVVKMANPLILLIPDTIFTITLIIVILLYNKLPLKIATHFDIQGNPDGWSPKISFLYLSILPQVILMVTNFIVFFAMRNRYRNPQIVYLVVIIISSIQALLLYLSLDIYWYNVYNFHILPFYYVFAGFVIILVLLLIIYNRLLIEKK